jgi:hypothetical protein
VLQERGRLRDGFRDCVRGHLRGQPEQLYKIERMIHVNPVPLVVHHNGREEGLLVYDCLPVGDLYTILHGNRGSGRTPFNWETWSSVAFKVVRAIAFLHSHGPTISHTVVPRFSAHARVTVAFLVCSQMEWSYNVQVSGPRTMGFVVEGDEGFLKELVRD